MTDRLTVVGAFDHPRAAHKAIEQWRRAGFREDQMGVLAREGGAVAGQETVAKTGSQREEGAGLCRGGGADIGLPWSMGMPFAFMPLLGAAWAGGLMASALVGTAAASSAAALGLMEALMGLGLPESGAKHPEKEVRAGRTLVPASAPGHPEEAKGLQYRDSAPEKNTLNAGAPAPASTRPAAHAVTTDAAHPDGAQKVQVREEELHVHKRPVQTGEVRIYKDVITEQQTLRVPVTREEVVIERRPVSGEPAAASDIRPGEELRIPVREEQVRVEKQAVVKEEVWVGKRQVHGTKEVSGEVRKEKVHIERQAAHDLSTANGGVLTPTPAHPATPTATTAPGHLQDAQKVQVREEELRVHKHPVPTGEVRVYKDVVTEKQTFQVPVTHEEVVIERHPIFGQVANAADIRPGEELRIPVREDQVQLDRQAVVKEEIWIGKRQVLDTKEVHGEVRKEKVRVERQGNVNLHGMSTPNGAAAVSEDDIRRHAYEKWEAAGRPAGDGSNFWLEAKRELQGR